MFQKEVAQKLPRITEINTMEDYQSYPNICINVMLNDLNPAVFYPKPMVDHQ